MKKAKNQKHNSKSKTNLIKIIDSYLAIKPKDLLSPHFWFVMILVYVSALNLMILRTTPELIFLQYTILVLLFIRVRTKEYAKTWIPFIALFLLYEFIRGYADNISPFRDITLLWIYNAETKIFGTLPTNILQKLFANNKFVVNTSLFFYSIFFYYSFLVAFILWLKKPKYFQKYFKGFIMLSFVGATFFFLIPTAPPWMVNDMKNLGLDRIIYKETILNRFSNFSLYQYFIYGNAIAAFPSLHTAWPAFTSLFLVKNFKSKVSCLSLIIPLTIGFSVVLSGEHYVIDVLAGFLLAYVINTLIFIKQDHSKNQTSAK